MAAKRVVIVGASLGGLRTAQALRQKGFDGAVTLVGDEPHLPYDRPPLSKRFLAGEWDEPRIRLADDDAVAKLELDLRLGQRAADLDVAGRRVLLHGGEPLPFDHVVIATGATPRQLPDLPDLEGVHVLRTLDDSVALRAALSKGPRVVVVGAGFIGAEVAATARTMGLDVTVLEALPVPLSRGLGPILGPAVAGLHAAHGVTLRTSAAVAGIDGAGRVERVLLADGSALEADLVVVGIGVVPATGWLEGSGLELRDGVVCDAACQAAPGVWAVGDVARWPNQLFGEEMRLEHWDNAGFQAMHVAGAIATGESAPYAPVPYVWSDQYTSMVQIIGRPHAEDEVHVVSGDLGGGPFLALTASGGLLTGVVGLDERRRTMRFTALLQRRAPLDEALALAQELSG